MARITSVNALTRWLLASTQRQLSVGARASATLPQQGGAPQDALAKEDRGSTPFYVSEEVRAICLC